jgi:Dolichyl-phosphate-mannose-protein mannosyltransferase
LKADSSINRKIQLAAAGLLLFGGVIRIIGFLQNASLSGDEAMLALSIGTRSLGGLLQPLDYVQVATVPFLWAERVITYVFGVSAYTLRIPTLLAGIALLWVLFRLARDLLGPVVALVALALAVTSSSLIR